MSWSWRVSCPCPSSTGAFGQLLGWSLSLHRLILNLGWPCLLRRDAPGRQGPGVPFLGAWAVGGPGLWQAPLPAFPGEELLAVVGSGPLTHPDRGLPLSCLCAALGCALLGRGHLPCGYWGGGWKGGGAWCWELGVWHGGLAFVLCYFWSLWSAVGNPGESPWRDQGQVLFQGPAWDCPSAVTFPTAPGGGESRPSYRLAN